MTLALTGEGGASAHDLAQMVRQGGPVYWTAAESKIYAEPKRLHELGYLSARTVSGQTRPKAVYRLTAKGRRALDAWLRSPAAYPRIQDSAHLRLLAGDRLSDEEILTSLAGLRERLDELHNLVDEMSEGEERFAGRKRRNLALAHDLARRMIDAYGGWVEGVERELHTAS